MKYLDQYFDPTLEVDLSLTPELLAASEVARLQDLYCIAGVAAGIPRRLSEATREELALDKKRSRRITHVFSQCISAWTELKVLEPSPEQRQRGAQINWADWWPEHEAWLKARQRYVGTWARKTSQSRVGRSIIVRLDNELGWLRYAMRE